MAAQLPCTGLALARRFGRLTEPVPERFRRLKASARIGGRGGGPCDGSAVLMPFLGAPAAAVPVMRQASVVGTQPSLTLAVLARASPSAPGYECARRPPPRVSAPTRPGAGPRTTLEEGSCR